MDQDKDIQQGTVELVKSTNQFPVVGIGASAGGLAAFKQLLGAITADSGMAYVLVQHLDPNHESMLPEILQKVCKIPVLEISDDIKVEPNHVYVIPSNKIMIASDGILMLAPRPAKSKLHLINPIDLFLSSLAEVHLTHSIGIILSGTGQDGTIGLKTIKEHGGLTIAQDEFSAAYESMPKSAIDAGVVDFILTPEKIPEKLLEVTSILSAVKLNDANFILEDEEVFRQIIALLRSRKGADFTYYKQTTIRRRIHRRMAMNSMTSPHSYLKFLQADKLEQLQLFQDVLIAVTSFFRDPKVFDNLSDSLFPLIIKNKQHDSPIRIWVAGCSSGEEAYSLAICIHEILSVSDKTINALKIQIFATDISEIAIEKARLGIYSRFEIEGVSPQRLLTYFKKSKGSFQVVKTIRDMVVFANHNFLKDPPFGKVDFLSCRNVLIYLEPYLQKKALTTFHYALNLAFNEKATQTSGFLLLGKSETTSGVPNLFTISTKHLNIFKRKDAPSKFMQVVSPVTEITINQPNNKIKFGKINSDFQKTADEILLNKYSPSGVVVNEALDIVQFRGSTSNYLEQLSGKPSHNILIMAKHGLTFELRNILHKVKKDKTAIIKEHIPVEVNGTLHNITIEAIPLPNTVEPYYLILFHDANYVQGHTLRSENKSPQKVSKSSEKDNRIKQLEEEIALTREDMRTITEDQEAVNGELQRVNEELMSGSEELQSLNEELETSKEELQSTNEELTVVNQEILILSEQITEAKNYAESIVDNIREPLLVLDKYLRIKTANNAFYKKFKVVKSDTEGALIYNLGNKQWDIPELRMLLEKVLPEKSFFNEFEVIHTFPEIGSLTMLLNAREVINKSNTEKLILLSIEDITERKLAEEKVAETEHKYTNFINSSNSLISILSGENLIIEMANEAILTSWGKGPDVIGKPLLEVLPELVTQGFAEILHSVFHEGKPYNAYEKPVYVVRNGISELIYYNFSYQPQIALNGKIEGISIISQEVTPQAILNKKIKESEETFRQLADLTPQKISNADSKGKFYYFNQKWQTYAGQTNEELISQGWTKFMHPTEVENIKKNWLHSIKTGNNFEMEMRLKGINGKYQWHLTKAIAIMYEAGTISKWIIAGTQIQEQIEQREILEKAVINRTKQLIDSNNELLKTNKELEAFAYVSSHDLQEPLRKIQTFAGLLLDKEIENLTPKGKTYFQLMHDAANRMQTLIEDLLTFSRLTSADRKLDRIDLNVIIEQVKEDFKEKIESSHAIFVTAQNCTAYVIAFQFHQLLYNLVGNALKFARPGIPPNITIKSRIIKGNKSKFLKLIPDNNYLHITFSDNGIGFDDKYNEQIFEVFQKLHGKEEYSGTGIGLAIVKKIVETHNGFIYATGKLNQGATFEIFIPSNN